MPSPTRYSFLELKTLKRNDFELIMKEKCTRRYPQNYLYNQHHSSLLYTSDENIAANCTTSVSSLCNTSPMQISQVAMFAAPRTFHSEGKQEVRCREPNDVSLASSVTPTIRQ